MKNHNDDSEDDGEQIDEVGEVASQSSEEENVGSDDPDPDPIPDGSH